MRTLLTSTSGTIKRLRDEHRLTAQEYRSILQCKDLQDCTLLQTEAQKASEAVFGRGVFVRGLIEVSNHCKNNCYYCGIRAANTTLGRYRLSKEEILDCCSRGYGLGLRTFVLQGGEDPAQSDVWVADVVGSIRKAFPDCAITLSLGEKSEEAYKLFRNAGADRYLLRHETINPEHYAKLHPATMSRDRRISCLRSLKALGYQTGSGIMVGSPWQTLDNVVEDILFIQDLQPEMIGIGPFVHHRQTPFADFPDGSVELTLKLISIFRLINPQALIPSTTALATLDSEGRKKGLLSGANVVMPNLSPASRRREYDLYEGKAAFGAEAAEGLEELQKELRSIGYDIVVGRGDYNNKKQQCTT